MRGCRRETNGARARGASGAAFVRAIAAMRCSALYDHESWAGAMLRLAGCSSGRSVCARGGWSARRCGALRSDALAGISVQPSLHYGRWRLQGRFPYAAFRGSFEVCLGRYAVMRALRVLRHGSVGRTRRSCGSVGAFCVRSRRFCGSVAVWVCLARQRALGYNEDLPGSNKRRPHCGWPGKSCGRTIASMRSVL